MNVWSIAGDEVKTGCETGRASSPPSVIKPATATLVAPGNSAADERLPRDRMTVSFPSVSPSSTSESATACDVSPGSKVRTPDVAPVDGMAKGETVWQKA